MGLFPVMPSHEGGRKVGKVSQIVKETGRIEKWVRFDNLCKVTVSSPIYMEVTKPFFHSRQGYQLNLNKTKQFRFPSLTYNLHRGTK